MVIEKSFIEDFLYRLSIDPIKHIPGTDVYIRLSNELETFIAKTEFAKESERSVFFGVFGELTLPYFSMGKIDSLKLFGLDEFIIFSFYMLSKNNYKVVADMGANIGLHSILMSKMGWTVTAYEPDPIHIERIHKNLFLNRVDQVSIAPKAISSKREHASFTRVIGNRTGSHLTGMKKNVYGGVDTFNVETEQFQSIMNRYDLIKMDIEGAEADAICATNKSNWANTDVIMEVGSVENAQKILDHLCKLEVNCYSQLTGWKKVTSLEQMPTSYKDGSLFVSNKGSPFYER